MIRKLKLDDDLKTVAKLIYNTDEVLFNSLFGSKENTTEKLKGLIELENNEYSYKNIHVFDDDGIKGIIVVHKFETINEWKRSEDFLKVFSIIPLMGIALKYESIKPLITEKDQGNYIDIVSVEDTERGKGIGSQLIKHIISLYEKEPLYLDVSVGNFKAKHLYVHLGFEVLKVTILSERGMGSYSMEYKGLGKQA